MNVSHRDVDVFGRTVPWHYWAARLRPSVELTPVRAALIYSLFGFAFLFLSDVVFVRYFSEPLLSQVQAIKGGVEVLLTAGLIFGLTRWHQIQLERANARLENQREELQLLHRVLRHNLRNDLNVVLGYLEDIRTDVDQDRRERQCERVLATAEQMEAYTEQAQRIRKVSEDDGRDHTVELAATVTGLLDDHPSVTPAVDVTTDLVRPLPVRVNYMFGEALRELIANAIEHDDTGTPAVTVETRPIEATPPMAEVTIVDDGPGIPESERAALADGDEEQLLHLSGMGLWFADRVVSHSGGELAIEDAETGGTKVRIRVPRVVDPVIDV